MRFMPLRIAHDHGKRAVEVNTRGKPPFAANHQCCENATLLTVPAMRWGETPGEKSDFPHTPSAFPAASTCCGFTHRIIP